MTERTIVNYGVYQFTEEEKQAYRVRLYTQVIRHPQNESINTKFQKLQSFYGYAQLMNGSHVHRTIQLRYEAECIFEYTASDNLNTFLISAHTYGILQSIANLAVLSGGVVEVDPLDPPLYPMPFDRIVFKLFSDTTLLVYTDIVEMPTLEITPALPTDAESDDPEPLSDTEPVENPLDEPYDIPTPPYNPTTEDNGETYSPEIPEEGTGEEGQRYRLYFMIRSQADGSALVGGYESVFAPYGEPFCQNEGGTYRCYVPQLSIDVDKYIGGASIACYVEITASELIE